MDTPLKVLQDDTAQLRCSVDSKPAVNTVKWYRNARFIDTNFVHTIPRASLQDAGSYTCSADNNLGQVGKADLVLDVLHAPIVALPERREVKEGEPVVEVECKVTANPKPFKIEWFKEGEPKFHQVGSTLRLTGIAAVHNGHYICSASNNLQPTGASIKMTKTGNSTISINVRHQPGKGRINPENPVAIEGRGTTLTCNADPSGYPEPQYEWWKGSADTRDKKTLAVGKDFTIESVRLGSVGDYHCQARNELGRGTIGSVYLEVYQAPKIITRLQPSILRKAGDADFHVSCSAEGKPMPKVKWLKNGHEILGDDSDMYQIYNKEQELSHKMAYKVVSTLKFVGPERIETSQLGSHDRGHYTCQFENDVEHGTDESTMLLRIEHSPVVVHQHNKVAYDKGLTARIPCRMQAYPEPRFDWSFANSVLQTENRRHYTMNNSALGDDVYESVLTVYNVGDASYGDYTCKAINAIGPKRTNIKLQPRSKPEEPINVHPIYTSYNFITLSWDDGFNGGYNDTKFTVEYKKLDDVSGPRYTDCFLSNPCNVSGLEQHTQYYVRVKSRNERGESKFSEEVAVATKVDVAMIPKPDNVHYEKSTQKASFNIDDTPLHLIAKIELEDERGSWNHYNGFLIDSNFGEMPVSKPVSNLRVRFCLETNELMCGPYTEALIVDVRPNATTSAGLAQPWLIGVVVFVVILSLTAALFLIKCCCCGNTKTKTLKTDDVSRPTIIHGTNGQQPPPYTNYSNGIENKGVESKDLSDDSLKANLFAPGGSQSAYPFATEQNSNNSNSANGGSVNSQDSLWNVKNNGGVVGTTVDAFAAAQIQQQQHQLQQQQQPAQQHYGMVHHQNGYVPYDPLAMQQQQQHTQTTANPGFGGSEDYTHYPYPDEYLNDRSRQYLQQQQQQQPRNGVQRQRMDTDCKYLFSHWKAGFARVKQSKTTITKKEMRKDDSRTANFCSGTNSL